MKTKDSQDELKHSAMLAGLALMVTEKGKHRAPAEVLVTLEYVIAATVRSLAKDSESAAEMFELMSPSILELIATFPKELGK